MSSIDKRSDLNSRRTQYTLPFPSVMQASSAFPVRYSPANERARTLLEAWCDSIVGEPGQGLIVTGPEASGKSFLISAIAARLNAPLVTGAQLEQVFADLAENSVIVVDDVHQVTEPALLTRFIDVSRERQVSFILAGRGKPETWAQRPDKPLQDLLTRLAAIPEASLDSPDEALMGQVLQDWLTARQINPRDELVDFAVARLKRSFWSLRKFVEQLDAEAMQQQKTIDKALIQSVLQRLPEHTLS